MFKKALALLLCSLLTLGTLAACGGDAATPVQPEMPQNSTQKPTQSAPTGEELPTTGPAAETEPSEAPTEPEETGMGNADTVIGAGMEYINTLRSRINEYNENGASYRGDNDKYGIVSIDGTYDSGAIYEAVDTIHGYFAVREAAYGEPEELDKINSIGLVDCRGNLIIPAKYAVLKAIDQRFIRAFTVTATTDSEDYLVYMRSSVFSLTAGEDDPRYVGTWCVYDMQTGKEVPGISGTTAVNVLVNGDVLTFTENDVKVRKNAAGQDIPLDATVFEDGSYLPKGGDAVYASDGTKRFDNDIDGFEIRSWHNGYYRMNKYEGGTSKYALADETGKICSAVFDFNPILEEGNLISGKGGLYDMQGQKLMEVESLQVNYYKDYWLIRDMDKKVYLMDSSYAVTEICQVDSDTYSFYSSSFAVQKKVEKDYFYYSVTQKDFAAGYTVAKGLAEVKNADGKKDLINTMTDEVVLSGYTQYRVEETEEGACIYAHAGSNVYDVFFFA